MQIFSSGRILLIRTAPILLVLLALTACTFSSPPVTTPEVTAVGAESPEAESSQTEVPTTAPSATEPSTVEPPDSEPAMPANGDALAGTSWELVAFGDSDDAVPVLENSTITLHFGTDGQVTGHGGCNEYGGSYVVQDSTIVFNEIVSTLVACVDQEITTQEQNYLQALGGAGRFEVTEEQLTLWYGGDNDAESGVLNFVPTDAASEDTPPVIPPVTPSESETLLPTVTPQPSDDTGGLPVDEVRRIEFDPGATMANRRGFLSEGGVQEYVLDARAGQTMHVQTVGYGAPVTFIVSSPSGKHWSGDTQASEVYIFTAQEVLPEDGDYTVTLSVPLDADATRYDVVFTITGSPISNIPSATDLPEDAGEAEVFT